LSIPAIGFFQLAAAKKLAIAKLILSDFPWLTAFSSIGHASLCIVLPSPETKFARPFKILRTSSSRIHTGAVPPSISQIAMIPIPLL